MCRLADEDILLIAAPVNSDIRRAADRSLSSGNFYSNVDLLLKNLAHQTHKRI